MNAFTTASLVEQRGLAILLPYLEERAFRRPGEMEGPWLMTEAPRTNEVDSLYVPDTAHYQTLTTPGGGSAVMGSRCR